MSPVKYEKWSQEFGAHTPGYASTMRVFNEKGEAVADVFWGGNDSSNRANLIAAAPDLCLALESLLAQYHHALAQVTGDSSPEAREARNQGIFLKANAALAKARGEL